MGVTKPLWFDRDALVMACGGHEQIMGNLLRAYLREGPKSLAALCKAVARGNAEQIEIAAHQVAGELLCLHARPVAAIARQIERAAAAGRVQGTPLLLSSLELATRELLSGLVPLAIGIERHELERHAVNDEDDGVLITIDAAGCEP
jgi:HPt (histidine-containing phosphotransfer) domain-containing protein